MEYRTFILIIMMIIYLSNQFMWFEINEIKETHIIQEWMREVAVILVLFVLIGLISIFTIQKIEGLDCRCH